MRKPIAIMRYTERPRKPMWTNDPVRDEMEYQEYLEDCRDYDESYDDGYADYWEDER